MPGAWGVWTESVYAAYFDLVACHAHPNWMSRQQRSGPTSETVSRCMLNGDAHG